MSWNDLPFFGRNVVCPKANFDLDHFFALGSVLLRHWG
jgi:hypothetical protein